MCFLNLPEEYQDLREVFSESRAASLPPHRPYDCAIDLVPVCDPVPVSVLLVGLWIFFVFVIDVCLDSRTSALNHRALLQRIDFTGSPSTTTKLPTKVPVSPSICVCVRLTCINSLMPNKAVYLHLHPAL
ncbi:unnamed protein product [Leuciscus chuanchicus]